MIYSEQSTNTSTNFFTIQKQLIFRTYNQQIYYCNDTTRFDDVMYKYLLLFLQ